MTSLGSGVSLALTALLAGATGPHAQDARAVGLPFADVLTAFKKELEIAQARSEPFCPLRIEEARLSFAVSAGATTETTVGGSFKVLGVAMGGEVEGAKVDATGNTVTIVLRPPADAGAERPVSAPVQMGLAALIAQIKAAVEAAARQPPPLRVAEITVSYSFELRQTQGGALEFIVVRGDQATESAASHKIDLTLRPMENARCG